MQPKQSPAWTKLENDITKINFEHENIAALEKVCSIDKFLTSNTADDELQA